MMDFNNLTYYASRHAKEQYIARKRTSKEVSSAQAGKAIEKMAKCGEVIFQFDVRGMTFRFIKTKNFFLIARVAKGLFLDDREIVIIITVFTWTMFAQKGLQHRINRCVEIELERASLT